jgi:hypothetical protein
MQAVRGLDKLMPVAGLAAITDNFAHFFILWTKKAPAGA